MSQTTRPYGFFPRWIHSRAVHGCLVLLVLLLVAQVAAGKEAISRTDLLQRIGKVFPLTNVGPFLSALETKDGRVDPAIFVLKPEQFFGGRGRVLTGVTESLTTLMKKGTLYNATELIALLNDLADLAGAAFREEVIPGLVLHAENTGSGGAAVALECRLIGGERVLIGAAIGSSLGSWVGEEREENPLSLPATYLEVASSDMQYVQIVQAITGPIGGRLRIGGFIPVGKGGIAVTTNILDSGSAKVAVTVSFGLKVDAGGELAAGAQLGIDAQVFVTAECHPAAVGAVIADTIGFLRPRLPKGPSVSSAKMAELVRLTLLRLAGAKMGEDSPLGLVGIGTVGNVSVGAGVEGTHVRAMGFSIQDTIWVPVSAVLGWAKVLDGPFIDDLTTGTRLGFRLLFGEIAGLAPDSPHALTAASRAELQKQAGDSLKRLLPKFAQGLKDSLAQCFIERSFGVDLSKEGKAEGGRSTSKTGVILSGAKVSLPLGALQVEFLDKGGLTGIFSVLTNAGKLLIAGFTRPAEVDAARAGLDAGFREIGQAFAGLSGTFEQASTFAFQRRLAGISPLVFEMKGTFEHVRVILGLGRDVIVGLFRALDPNSGGRALDNLKTFAASLPQTFFGSRSPSIARTREGLLFTLMRQAGMSGQAEATTGVWNAGVQGGVGQAGDLTTNLEFLIMLAKGEAQDPGASGHAEIGQSLTLRGGLGVTHGLQLKVGGGATGQISGDLFRVDFDESDRLPQPFAPVNFATLWNDMNRVAAKLAAMAAQVVKQKAEEIVRAMLKAKKTTAQTINALHEEGYRDAVVITRAFKAAGAKVDGQLAKALRAAGYTASQVLQACKQAGLAGRDALAGILKTAGFKSLEVAGALRSAGWKNPAEIAKALKKAGWSAPEVATTLKKLGFKVVTVAKALREADWTKFIDIARALKKAGFKTVKDLTAALLAVGARLIDLPKLL